jgi:hypothetical protein
MKDEQNEDEINKDILNQKLLKILLILSVALIIFVYALYTKQFEKIDDSYSNIDYLQDIMILSQYIDTAARISQSEKFVYKRELDALKQEAYNPKRKNRKHKTDAFFKKFGLERNDSSKPLPHSETDDLR